MVWKGAIDPIVGSMDMFGQDAPTSTAHDAVAGFSDVETALLQSNVNQTQDRIATSSPESSFVFSSILADFSTMVSTVHSEWRAVAATRSQTPDPLKPQSRLSAYYLRAAAVVLTASTMCIGLLIF